MTTIAFDGKTLAADSRTLGSSMIRSEETGKLFALPDGGWFAGCGGQEDVLLALRWMIAGMVEAQKPALDDHFAGLILRGNRLYRVEKRLVEWECKAAHVAAGSGFELALGAMAAGADAIQAVKIAARFDPSTNARVQYVTVNGDHGVVE